MSLLKKTYILAGQPPKGYLTALKIGATRGVKLSMNSVSPEMTLAVKIGGEPTEAFTIRALKEEFRVAADFDEKTDLKAVVFENGAVYAYTGSSPAIEFNEWNKKTSVKREPEPPSNATDTSGSAYDEIKTNAPREAAKDAANKAEEVYYEPVLQQETEANPRETVAAEVVGNKEDDTFRFFKKQSDAHFYDRIRGRIDEMFVIHPKEESLEKMIPDSKWVRVPYSEDEFYVVGILMDAGRVTHVGYGVRGLRSVFPPKEAEALSEFLPTDGDAGYWLMFQDAETGAMLPVD